MSERGSERRALGDQGAPVRRLELQSLNGGTLQRGATHGKCLEEDALLLTCRLLQRDELGVEA